MAFFSSLFRLWIIIIFSSCVADGFYKTGKEVDEFSGFTILVDYGEEVEEYRLEREEFRMDLRDLLAHFSLMSHPSMRFISTNKSLRIYDIMGTRNNFEKEWEIFVDGKWISGEELFKGIVVDRDSRITIRYTKATRIFLPLPREKL